MIFTGNYLKHERLLRQLFFDIAIVRQSGVELCRAAEGLAMTLAEQCVGSLVGSSDGPIEGCHSAHLQI